ncbi:MAG: mechanosensitive ion channel family protein [Crocosphaera sp.]|nr:mechanosensitive ion channel family protein [Crocosphaera sp.]
MSRLSVFLRVQVITTTTIVSVFTFISVPVLSQDVLAQGQSTSVESTESASEEKVVEEKPSIQAVTAKDPNISIELLEVLLKPLPQDNLQAEADAWFALLKAKAEQISDKEAAIQRQAGQGEISGEVDTEKEQNIVTVSQLEIEQSNLVNRLTTVLDALDAKGGDTTTYRQYVGVVSGIQFNLTDAESLGLRFTTWLTSPEGGIRLGFNLVKFVGILIIAIFIAPRLGRLTDSALTRVTNISNLFRGFVVMIVKRGVLVIGALLALASVGVNLGPILAVVGGASFVLAFALQSNLGNFASGLMLLINKPFDVGDEVKVAGYWAYVDSISLASTKLKDFGGNTVTLPNNTVWGSDIINYTHSDSRKFMVSIYVKFTEDLDTIKKLWMDIASSHPKVLKNPAPGWFPWNSHYEYYISVGLSAWLPTDDFWPVYVELLKAIQTGLQEANIELAAPEQNIKLYQAE